MTNPDVLNGLHSDMIVFLNNVGYDQTELENLKFELKISKDGTDVKVIAKNFVTALWFSNVYPDFIPSPEMNALDYENNTYFYNSKNGTIKIK